jgi:hypothetical protein
MFPVKDLKLDMRNYRTVAQPSEAAAVQTMISINPDWFWALTESLLDDGYHPTENILVLRQGTDHVVREGNRRVGALKLIMGTLGKLHADLPPHIKAKIEGLSKEWKASNKEVPCAIYEESEAAVVARIVNLTHGKGEQAGRDWWNAVASARHNREENGASESALDLLEKYLANSDEKDLPEQRRERWSGVYPLTVLEDAIKRLAPRFGAADAKAFVKLYPKEIKKKKELDALIRDIGLETVGFKTVRNDQEDFAARYGLPTLAPPAAIGGQQGGAGQGAGGQGQTQSGGGQGSGTGTTGGTGQPTPSGRGKTKAVSTNDPRSVIRALKKFSPVGNGRAKLVTILDEARTLNIEKQPHCFCFALRSMFDLSAKAYCDDHKKMGLTTVDKNGRDRPLVDVLRDIVSHMTNGGKDKAKARELHGPITELAKPHSPLSVTSMNQVIHHRSFVVDAAHISTYFSNVFPLLEEMNK